MRYISCGSYNVSLGDAKLHRVPDVERTIFLMTETLRPPNTESHEKEKAVYASEDQGLQKGMSNRQLQMIAIGSAIGTGLLLGTGGRLQTAGPFLAVLYLVRGFFG